ncbi:thiamine phosphate synthase [Candidatus Kryptobacter tengchongensis]|uniref:Thiamine-phosphate synthase n=1 Tax=Kryptobacter tengchongensis TaxID=1643429 RepID=A0A656D6E9_KRYT1|nr:thiamine phosphate synthase [Candidatus Kryptobacter tengchongensis]CUS99615.1 thiamine-phosphate pyrophosphorylase [Candidatus Kryptobacter tengchongensis]
MRIKGLYFVVDISAVESLGLEKLCEIVEKAIIGGVNVIQLWADRLRWEISFEKLFESAKKLIEIAHKYNIPVLIANDVELCAKLNADGVHLDGYEIPDKSGDEIRKIIGFEKIIGVTCGNDIKKIEWAKQNGIDYISFCSIFPTSSVDTCEIVPIEMIRKAKEILGEEIPVFASGGITVENVDEVLSAGADGIAVVSAIMKAEDPKEVSLMFREKLKKLFNEI